jgi:two-component system, response regulator
MNNYNDVEILIVEDNPNDAELALRALQKNKVSNHVQLVRDGEEALDFIFARGRYSARSINFRPKVILLDLKLPKINGLEVLKVLKEDPRTRAIPVVMMTSSSEESDMVASYEMGVNSYIVKPVDFEKFVDSVRDLGFYWLLLNQRPD